LNGSPFHVKIKTKIRVAKHPAAGLEKRNPRGHPFSVDAGPLRGKAGAAPLPEKWLPPDAAAHPIGRTSQALSFQQKQP